MLRLGTRQHLLGNAQLGRHRDQTLAVDNPGMGLRDRTPKDLLRLALLIELLPAHPPFSLAERAIRHWVLPPLSPAIVRGEGLGGGGLPPRSAQSQSYKPSPRLVTHKNPGGCG